MSELKKIHDHIGYSGHERGIYISVAAFALGAEIIEKHFTLNRNMAVSYTHLRAHETKANLVCRLLLEKQKLMYTRISLSKDPEAIELKEHLEQSVRLLGFPEGTDMSLLFSGMSNTIDNLKTQLDS